MRFYSSTRLVIAMPGMQADVTLQNNLLLSSNRIIRQQRKIAIAHR
jgi:hypothetical protein